MSDINLRKLKQNLSKYIEEATLGASVIDLLSHGDSGGVAPVEGELLDYKRDWPIDALGMAKTARQVVSLYNTFGGYLIYGVDQNQADTEFFQCGINADCVDLKQLKDLIRTYTGENVDVTYASVQKGEHTIGQLHVPKRREQTPLAFGKNGPDKSPGKPIFCKDQVYFRNLDNCTLAQKKEDWQFLFGDRLNPHLCDDWTSAAMARRSPILDHNLPDRHFICQKFIGRDDIIHQLWQWLGDDFAHAKLLAGDGGKGKTSIAYEFAEEVCRTSPLGFEKIIWVTAKKQQFVAFHDEYISVPETHYEDLETLLRAVCSELALMPDEIEGASTAMLKKLLKGALTQIPALVIIDDIDSLELEQQRMALEFAMQMATTKSRFLLTTRMNLSYSEDARIAIAGLQWEEYREYLDTWMQRMPGMKLSEQQAKKLHGLTEGSPLFTESVLRLINSGMTVDTAVGQWGGKLGDEVRKAALEREIDNLSVEARRVLLAAAYMQNCSYAELMQVTAYGDERLHICITELRALFLLSAPSIAEEARFQVPVNTQTLVLQNKQLLARDFRNLSEQVTRLRSQTAKRTGNQRQIGLVISQANAFLQQKNFARAIETADAALKGNNKKHPDLLLMRGRCLLAQGNGHSDDARKIFRTCFELGQRKDILFKLWFESELRAKHPSGGVEAATAALDSDVGTRQEWLGNRALSHRLLANDRDRVGDLEGALSEMEKCRRDIVDSTKVCTSVRGRHELQEVLSQINDETWNLLQKRQSTFSNWLVAYDEVLKMLKSGDQRASIMVWLLTALTNIIRLAVAKPENESRYRKSVDIANHKLVESRRAIDKYSEGSTSDKSVAELQELLEGLEHKLSSAHG